MNIFNKNKTNIYFLLYKLKVNHQLWVVKISDNIDDLEYFKKFVNNVFSNTEKYYIVKRETNEIDIDKYLNYKSFTKFKILKKDKILKESNINKYYIDYLRD